MISKVQLLEKLHYFIETQLCNIAKTNPVVSFIKPIVIRVIRKKIPEIDGFLDLISDDQGMIDAESIISEMTTSLINTQPFSVNIPTLGNIVIGNGKINIGIPFTDKSIILNEQDLVELRELLTNK